MRVNTVTVIAGVLIGSLPVRGGRQSDDFPLQHEMKLAVRMESVFRMNALWGNFDGGYGWPHNEREHDIVPYFRRYMEETGCTTNQLINGFIYLATNFVNNTIWNDAALKSEVADNSWFALSAVNHPLARSFLLQACTNSPNVKLAEALPGVFRYTNLEPEVFDYLRTVCVQTNRYEDCSAGIALVLRNVCRDLPSEVRPAATTNLCKYIYFSIGQSSEDQLALEHELVGLLPTYSNSYQRIEVLRNTMRVHPSEYSRNYAQRILRPLLRIPTNELNDVSWITGD